MANASPERHSWKSMKERCNNPRHRFYARYGGRGIKVCDRWENSFSDFCEDMGHRPSPEHSLDRIDNDGHYEPGNCRWATKCQQENNKSNTRIVVYRGHPMSLKQAAALAGIDYSVVWHRINNGWDVAKAISAPVRRNARSAS